MLSMLLYVFRPTCLRFMFTERKKIKITLETEDVSVTNNVGGIIVCSQGLGTL